MSKILKVSQNDYRVKVQDGGTITLDTGSEQGLVVITGDLKVLGDTTTIDTANMVVEDNILVLNREVDANGNPITHTGITLGEAGIEIDRGTLDNSQILFDENRTHYDPLVTTDIDGTFVFKTADGSLSGIQTNSISSNGQTDIVFDMHDSDRVLSVVNSDAATYANRLGISLGTVADTPEDNFIPNKKFILGYISSGVVVPGQADVDRIYYAVGSVEKARAQASLTSLEFAIAGITRAQITATGLDVDDINLYGNTITSTGAYNLVLTAANNHVEINSVLNLDDQLVAPGPTSSKTRIYSSTTAGPGRTGLFFTNNTTYGNNATSNDELVAKNRALLFSMIF